MNTLIIAALLSIATPAHSEGNTINSDVKRIIEKSVTVNAFDLPLQTHENGLVRIQLKVDQNGKIEILDVNYSHPELNELMVKQLATIQVDKRAANEVFFYEFRFEKH